jgi:multidrug efflux pump subunit AcrA (membrane-fusion protein)
MSASASGDSDEDEITDPNLLRYAGSHALASWAPRIKYKSKCLDQDEDHPDKQELCARAAKNPNINLPVAAFRASFLEDELKAVREELADVKRKAGEVQVELQSANADTARVQKELQDERKKTGEVQTELKGQVQTAQTELAEAARVQTELESQVQTAQTERAEATRVQTELGEIERLKAVEVRRDLNDDARLAEERDFEQRMNGIISGVTEAVREGAQLLGIPIAQVEGPLEEDTPLATCVERLATQASLRMRDNWERPIEEFFQRFGPQGAVQEDQPLSERLGQLFEKLKDVVREEHDEVVLTHAHMMTIFAVLVGIYEDRELADREQIAVKDTLIEQLLERKEFLRTELKKRNAMIQELSEALGLQDVRPEITK